MIRPATYEIAKQIQEEGNTMEVQELINRKKEAESQIVDILKSFTRETGQLVKAVETKPLGPPDVPLYGNYIAVLDVRI